MRSVSLDRAFYRPLPVEIYARLAAQVPADFRFVVKAPSLLTDAVRRDPATGAALEDNPHFLDPVLAVDAAWGPALEGLGPRLGALVFQLSPLPARWLQEPATLVLRLDALWDALERDRLNAAARPDAATGVAGATAAGPSPPTPLIALEVRDPALLGPRLVASLKARGVRLCLGLHDRLPPIEAQLPAQRALWPGDLVCRWNLQRGQRYAQARDAWAPFDRLQAPDEPTRQALARVMKGTLDAGHRVFVTINNKAEGSAPLSVLALAQALHALG